MKLAALALALGSLVLAVPRAASAQDTSSWAGAPTTPTVDASAESESDEDGEDEHHRDGSTASDADDRAEDVVTTFGQVVSAVRSSDGPAPTTQQHRVVWREDWPRYSFDEAILSLGLGALLVAAELLPTATTSANWTGGILFDQNVRDGLRLRSPDARESARVASEVLQWVLITAPFVVDALAGAGIGDGNWDAGFQMGLIALESYVISLVIWKVTVLLARRERPIASRCVGVTSPECSGDLETTSFFSNQAMNSFTGASLMCLHHTHMPLFGDEAADVSACVVGMTAATMVGLLRVMSDREYLTDVLMGAIVGFVAGYIIPWAVHYQGGARPELRPAPSVAIIPVPLVAPGETYGLQVAGWF